MRDMLVRILLTWKQVCICFRGNNLSPPMTSALTDHLGFWLRLTSNHVSGRFARALEAAGVSVVVKRRDRAGYRPVAWTQARNRACPMGPWVGLAGLRVHSVSASTNST